MNVILIGYRGTGKSTVGEIVSELLDFPLVETDAAIIEKAGQSISEIVSKHSWDYFRELESEVIREVSTRDRTVIDCGGGVILNPGNVAALKTNGIVFLLKADFKDIITRIASSSDRPSLTGDKSFTEEVEEVLRERAPLYQASADYVINTSRETPASAAEKIAGMCLEFTNSRQES